MAEKKISREDIHKLLETYTIATGVNTRAFSANGRELFSFPEQEDIGLPCRLIRNNPQGREDCHRSYLYGGLQAEKLSDYYIYFCPYGMINWTVPIFEDNKMKYFLTAGPVLMYEVNELLFNEIIQQNQQLKEEAQELMERLQKLPVIDPVRVRHLANLLFRLAKELMAGSIEKLEKRQEVNITSRRIGETIHRLKSGEAPENKNLYPFEKENELISRVKLGDLTGAREVLNEILGYIYFQSGGKFAIVKSKAIELMVVLARAAIEANADLEIIFGLEYMYLGSIDKVKNIEELSEWLITVLDRFIGCIFSIRNVKNKDIIFKAMSYIRENHDRNISLDEVASEVGLNPSYFSKLFKEEMKLSYTDYLNMVRIESGKKMLKEGHPLVNVAQSVGFNDQSYFSKVFKKFEGVSPGKWRSQDI